MSDTQYDPMTHISEDQWHASRHVRHKLLRDPYRPRYHFVSPEGFDGPFDPNGNIYWRGRHHMGYIYMERGVFCWGHVSSIDLLHWRHHGPMLMPTLDSPENGIFSGNAYLDKDGRRVLCMYHGCGAGNCLAWSDDDNLEHWHKLPGNPLAPNPPGPNPLNPDGADHTSWDPCGWIEGDTYYGIFGGQKNTVWKSRDLKTWTKCGPLLAEAYPGIDFYEDISCPDFFPVRDKWVMVCISHRLGTRYYVGRWENEKFHPEYHEMMSFCDNEFFAPESHTDGRGRRIMLAWVFDGRNTPVRNASGWSGTMSLPRVLTLGADNRLLMTPVEELATLRYNPFAAANVNVADGAFTPVPFRAVEENVLDTEAELAGAGAAEFGIDVCCSADGGEFTRIGYETATGRLKIDTHHTGPNQRKCAIEAAPINPLGAPPAGPLKLRIFVDRSIVEVFANDGKLALSRTVFPSKGSGGIRLYALGGAAKATSLRVWDIMPTNAC